MQVRKFTVKLKDGSEGIVIHGDIKVNGEVVIEHRDGNYITVKQGVIKKILNVISF